MVKHFILQLAFLLPCLCVFPQEGADHSPKQLSVGLRGSWGSFFTSHPKAEYVRDSYSSFGEFFAEVRTNGEKDWQILHRYPSIGVGYMLGNPGSRQYVGNLQALYPYARFSLVRTGGYEGSLKLGGGLAWISKPFNAETNPKNTLIGTRFNALLNLNFQQQIRLSDRLLADAGIGILHVSNGGITLPNLGLNIPNINVGLRYIITEAPVMVRSVKDSSSKKIDWSVHATVAIKQYPWIGGSHYLINGFQMEGAKRIGNSTSIGAGLAFFYNRTIRKYHMPTYLDSNTKKLQAGIFLSYEHFLGRLSIPVQVGGYFYNASKSGGIFQQYGLRYLVTRHLLAELLLKSHMGQADFIHSGFGYKF